MSDLMRPLAFADLMNWILEEKANHGTIFGISRPFVKQNKKILKLFGENLEMPFGPAAGPHTQLAQNIITAYYAGSRFFELKTVQVIDGEDLPVSKPCINAADEGYNVEWSTELRVEDAYKEYVRAWFALKLIAKEFALGQQEGFIFNMSVGYDYDGIRSPKIDNFIEGLKDASKSEVWHECREYALSNLDRFKLVDADFINQISPKVCNSITLSTLHGCPPQEIERISRYLLKEKGLHTYIKCNPTLLGYKFARNTLDQLGFGYLQFDDHHFLDDLQYTDAIVMFKRMLTLAEDQGLTFGVKLTNTFPVEIAQQELPGEEMFMSGRALYPLSIHLAKLLSKEFNGALKISYSGGADFFNILQLFQAGIWPITLATSLLKTGGYQRLEQIAQAIEVCDFPVNNRIDQAAVAELAKQSLCEPRYKKSIKPIPKRKLNQKVPLLDCFIAPCQEGCPINQDIPAYVGLVGEGRYEEALKVILDKNPLPFITGTICNHRCKNFCTRNYYDEAIKIRSAKLEAAQKSYVNILKDIKELYAKSRPVSTKVAIVGGGPAGLAAAYLLKRGGLAVTIFEKRANLGGVVRNVIPEFRISANTIEKDIQLIQAMGIEFQLGREVKSTKELFEKGFKYVILALGASQPEQIHLEQGQAINALDFLEQYKHDPEKLELGKDIVVIGGGNTAMDAARAAKRISKVEKVSIVYRRTQNFMPADEEELKLALSEGINIYELLAPIALIDSKLKCYKMVLGNKDDSGRPRPVRTEEIVEIPSDALISAVGGKAIVDEKSWQTKADQVYLIGDALRGPATVVEAIADATKASAAILKAENLLAIEKSNKDLLCQEALLSFHNNQEQIRHKKGKLCLGNELKLESKRCLECSTICENCVEVCPNRANIAIELPNKSMTQIIHIDRMCNECGNCATFCPFDSDPYKDKFTLFNNEEDYQSSTNEGFLLINKDQKKFRIRLSGEKYNCNLEEARNYMSKDIIDLLEIVLQKYSYLF